MTETTRLEAALSSWLAEEAAVRPPDRLVHKTRTAIAQTPQRRVIRGRLALPSVISLRPLATLAVIGSLVVAVASLAIYLPRSGPAVSPSPSPSQTATPNPTPTLSAIQPYECQRSRGTCLGPLAAGVYETTTFVPAVRFSVPAGWTNTYDIATQFDLSWDTGGHYTYPDGITFSDRISMLANPLAESSTSSAPIVGIGTSAAQIASWLAAHADVVASAPTPVSVGGASGYSVAVSLPTQPRGSPDQCAAIHGESRCVSLLIGADRSAEYTFGLTGPESAVVYLLDVPSGGTLMVVIDDVDGVDAAGLVTAAIPTVESIGFVR